MTDPLRWLPLLLGLMLGLGCSGRDPSLPKTTPVSGVVTYRGKPIERGTIAFVPKQGERPAGGQLGPGGRFTLTTFTQGDGAVLGPHAVTIESFGDGDDVSTGKRSSGFDRLVPAKFSDLALTPLSVDVVEPMPALSLELQD